MGGPIFKFVSFKLQQYYHGSCSRYSKSGNQSGPRYLIFLEAIDIQFSDREVAIRALLGSLAQADQDNPHNDSQLSAEQARKLADKLDELVGSTNFAQQPNGYEEVRLFPALKLGSCNYLQTGNS